MLHIFDIDKTILNTSTVKDVLFSGIRRGVIPASVLIHVPYYVFLFGFAGVKERHFEKPRQFLTGLSEKELSSVARQLYESKFRKIIFPEIEELIEAIQSKGEEVIIASASFRFILEPLAEGLGVNRIICTELEFENGISTGRITGLPAFKEGKQLRVQSYLKSVSAELSDCCFYTDSHRDLGLLYSVGTAVAVNPDKRLRKAAGKNGWELIEVKKPGRINTWQT